MLTEKIYTIGSVQARNRQVSASSVLGSVPVLVLVPVLVCTGSRVDLAHCYKVYAVQFVLFGVNRACYNGLA